LIQYKRNVYSKKIENTKI